MSEDQLGGTEMYAYVEDKEAGGVEDHARGVLFPSGELYVRFDGEMIVGDSDVGSVAGDVYTAGGFVSSRVDVTAASVDDENPTDGPALRLLRVCFESERTRVDIDGWLMGFGVQFYPSGRCVLHWNRDAYPEKDRLDHPHVSLYSSLADVKQGTGGDVEQIGLVRP